LRSLCPRYSNVVVVDDGSSDATLEAALGFPVWVLRHPINCGQGAALRTGIGFAVERGAAVVVTFDADGQHDAGEIPRMVAPIAEGRADAVLGSRFLGQLVGIPWTRRLVLLGGVLFTRIFSGVRVTDTHNGFRAFSRSAAEQIRFAQDRMAHASEIIDQLRVLQLKFCEVPVTIRYTEATLAKGQSSWNAIKIAGQLLLGRLLR
jgi:glycosyltransferase involved in cell wall biosynthesis